MNLSDKVTGIAPSLTLRITALSNTMKANGIDVVGFGAGEPDFDTPTHIKDAAKEALDNGFTKYTAASGTPALKQAVCDRYLRKYGMEYAQNQIVVSSGAKQSLFNAFQATVNAGDEVIIQTPYWLTYPELVRMAGGVPVFVESTEKTDFKVSAEQIEAAVTDKTKVILINNPSNPCGSVYTKKELEEIAEVAKKHDLFIISDEIYDDLVYDGTEIFSIGGVSEDAKERTIIINGMSKSYAMTGWRIGYTLSNKKAAKAMGNFQSHSASNPCSIAQYASVAALNGPQEALDEMVALFDYRRKLMYKLINKIDGVSALMPKGAFYIMMNIEQLIGKKFDGKVITDPVVFSEILLEAARVAVVPGTAFGDDKHVRMSYATSAENIAKGIKRIAEFVEKIR